MRKIVQLLSGAVCLMLMVTTLSVSTTSAQISGKDQKQQRVTALEAELQAAIDKELETGETVDTPTGKKLAGRSAEKIAQLHESMRKNIDDVIARPINQRKAAINRVSAFTGASLSDIQYDHSGPWVYSPNIMVETYIFDSTSYDVDTRTNEIVNIVPMPLQPGESTKTYKDAPALQVQQLEQLARRFAKTLAQTQLKGLTANHQQKLFANQSKDQVGVPTKTAVAGYFFRWEDRNLTNSTSFPFIQIGLSASGDLLSFTSTLGINNVNASSKVRTFDVSTIYTYANNGSYYEEGSPNSGWNTVYDQGFCYFAGWCNPKTMKWTTSWNGATTNYGKWKPISIRQYGNVYTYIPCVHAAAKYAPYTIVYAAGTLARREVNQYNICNGWVSLGSYFNTEFVMLSDSIPTYKDTYGTEIGFDEIRICYNQRDC